MKYSNRLSHVAFVLLALLTTRDKKSDEIVMWFRGCKKYLKNTEVKSSEKVKLEIIHSLKKQCKKNFHQGPRENAVTPCYQ